MSSSTSRSSPLTRPRRNIERSRGAIEDETDRAEIILKSLNANEEKELELKKKEAELNGKIKELEALKLKEIENKEVEINDDQIALLLNKLESVKSTIINKYKDNKVCGIYDKIPTIPNDAFSINFENIDVDVNSTNKNYEPYLWCMCNDENKKSEDCINYFDCNKNYVINKDKKRLEDKDLTLYMKCINKYPNFPKYLTENNQTIL